MNLIIVFLCFARLRMQRDESVVALREQVTSATAVVEILFFKKLSIVKGLVA